MIRVAAAALLLIGPASASLNAQPTPTPVSARPFAGREPYSFPFRTRDEWLAFVRGMPDGAAAAATYAALFSQADWDRYRAGTTTRATRITYRSDGLLIRGVMVEPRAPGPHPVVIFNHGGVMRWGRIVPPDLLEFHRLAERGYIVLASTHRGVGGSEGDPSMDGGDVDDVLALLGLVDALPGADPGRIGMWGFSRGGLVTYGALARTDRLAAAMIVGGPTDLSTRPAAPSSTVSSIRTSSATTPATRPRRSPGCRRSAGPSGWRRARPSCSFRAAAIRGSNPATRCAWRWPCNGSSGPIA